MSVFPNLKTRHGKVRFFDQEPAAGSDRLSHFLQHSLAFRQMG